MLVTNDFFMELGLLKVHVYTFSVDYLQKHYNNSISIS